MAKPSGSDGVEELTLNVPDTAILPEGVTFWEGADDGRCRVIKADGARCGGTRMRAYGLCPGHAGIGGVATDPHAASLAAATERSSRRQARLLLGVSARRAADPAQAARLRAQLRANDFARAIVDDPLDDESLSAVARQRAAIAAVELLWPKVEGRIEVELPGSADEVSGLGWSELQQLASQLLD